MWSEYDPVNNKKIRESTKKRAKRFEVVLVWSDERITERKPMDREHREVVICEIGRMLQVGGQRWMEIT